MSLACVYHASQPFRVVEDAIAEEMVASGEWFRHPNDVNKQKEISHEKPIQRKSRKGSVNSECSP
jgi:hypothetical protein